MGTPISFTTGGYIVAYYARGEIYRSCLDPLSVTGVIWMTEHLVMAYNRSYKEALNGRFWSFSDALFGRV